MTLGHGTWRTCTWRVQTTKMCRTQSSYKSRTRCRKACRETSFEFSLCRTSLLPRVESIWPCFPNSCHRHFSVRPICTSQPKEGCQGRERKSVCGIISLDLASCLQRRHHASFKLVCKYSIIPELFVFFVHSCHLHCVIKNIL